MNTMREEFEAWAKARKPEFTHDDAWDAWQAALSAHQPAGEAVPVVWIPLHEMEFLRKGQKYNWMPTVWAKNNGGDCVPLYDTPNRNFTIHFLHDVVTAAGLLSTGGQSKALAARISDMAYRLMAVSNGK